jgi:hypothetical protein
VGYGQSSLPAQFLYRREFDKKCDMVAGVGDIVTVGVIGLISSFGGRKP